MRSTLDKKLSVDGEVAGRERHGDDVDLESLEKGNANPRTRIIQGMPHTAMVE